MCNYIVSLQLRVIYPFNLVINVIGIGFLYLFGLAIGTEITHFTFKKQQQNDIGYSMM